jgi:cytochrome c
MLTTNRSNHEKKLLDEIETFRSRVSTALISMRSNVFRSKDSKGCFFNRIKKLSLIMTFIFNVNSISAQDTNQRTGILRGREIYENRCMACHSAKQNRTGPMHQGVFGRKAGLVKDYDYSQSLRSSRVIWNDESLDQWLKDPETFIPGQKMWISVTEQNDRAAIIAYLKTLKN